MNILSSLYIYPLSTVLQTHTAAELSPGPGPAPEYEAYRRRAARDVQELWLYARARLESLQQEGGGAQAAALQEVAGELETRQQAVLGDLQRMAGSDGHQAWRETEARDLSRLVQVEARCTVWRIEMLLQGRLQQLQHPGDCSKARKLVCRLDLSCGLGCQLHHVTYCLIVAYGERCPDVILTTVACPCQPPRGHSSSSPRAGDITRRGLRRFSCP